ncbi:hypothetical protein TNIN_365681 [Trichonephila inaurata madagascariensis]|uniref:Uncharacterized protein n=1 Tax=Trichonephila inaurata madagascariensis TaxID=2747483 RepID=A0A8X7C1M0_9ARAC|nr:hypothetical protein TNIN_365681 [Trichonephila inaurata madagascariensis]
MKKASQYTDPTDKNTLVRFKRDLTQSPSDINNDTEQTLLPLLGYAHQELNLGPVLQIPFRNSAPTQSCKISFSPEL